MDAAWGSRVLSQVSCKPVLGADAAMAFKGPRVKMALYQDTPAGIQPNPRTGMATYSGAIASRSADGPAVLHLISWRVLGCGLGHMLQQMWQLLLGASTARGLPDSAL